MAADNPICVSRQQAAALLDCSVQMIDKLIKAGRIPARYLGTAVRIRVADLEVVLEPYNAKAPRGVRVAKSKKRRAA